MESSASSAVGAAGGASRGEIETIDDATRTYCKPSRRDRSEPKSRKRAACVVRACGAESGRQEEGATWTIE